MRQITYHTQPAAPPAQAQPALPAPRSALGERTQAALTAGLGLGLGLFVILNGIYVAISGTMRVQVVLVLSIVAAVAGLLLSCYCLVRWSIDTASRDWRVDHAERKRQWSLEDEDRAWAREEVERTHETAAPASDLTWVHALALALLERHYRGQKTTRAACTKEDLCTQTEWNLVNRAFRAIGFKRGNTLSPPETLPQAWAAWVKQVTIHDGDLWCKATPSGKGGIEVITPPK